MGIFTDIVDTKKGFEPASEGQHAAVIADVFTENGEFDGKPRKQIVLEWLTDEKNEDGSPKRVRGYFSFTFFPGNDKRGPSKLYTAFVAMGLTPPPQDESVDVEPMLLGRQTTLMTVHKESAKGTIYAAPTVLKTKANQSVVSIPADYLRKKDRPGNGDGKPF